MRPEDFIRMMNELPDSVIDEANTSDSGYRPYFRYIMTAAACLIVLLSAALYQRLHRQTPDIPVLPVAETDTPETDLSALVQTETTQTAQKTESAVTTTAASVSDMTTTAVPTDTQITRTTVPDTGNTNKTSPVQTTAYTVTAQSTSLQTQETQTSQSEEPHSEETGTVPIWAGVKSRLRAAAEPQVNCLIQNCHADTDESLRVMYGIPAEIDLTDTQCLLITIDTEYADAALIGGEITEQGLTLLFACLDRKADRTGFRFAIPLPDHLTVNTENCAAKYMLCSDEAEYQAYLTDHIAAASTEGVSPELEEYLLAAQVIGCDVSELLRIKDVMLIPEHYIAYVSANDDYASGSLNVEFNYNTKYLTDMGITDGSNGTVTSDTGMNLTADWRNSKCSVSLHPAEVSNPNNTLMIHSFTVAPGYESAVLEDQTVSGFAAHDVLFIRSATVNDSYIPSSDYSACFTWGFAALGDVNNNKHLDSGDIISLANSLSSLTTEQRAVADFNRDGTVDVKDLVAMKDYLGIE